MGMGINSGRQIKKKQIESQSDMGGLIFNQHGNTAITQ